ncbi:unnamed protein product [Peniophora sp. CBMAI 1063]|nr:unnamed protein product [Peniophora sp. CBMAI 1063]
MPKAPKAETLSHKAAVRYLRTILPTYAPGAAGKKDGGFQKEHWAEINSALDALDSGSQMAEGGDEGLGAITSESATVASEKPKPRMEHCVRCHDEFDLNDGGYCEIPHVFDDEPSFSGEYDGYSKIYDYESRCCRGLIVQERGSGNGEFLDLEDDAAEPCIELEHTIDPAEVDYNGMNVVESKPRSKSTALTYLRTVLPAYAPGPSGSKSRRFLVADWVHIEGALIELGGPLSAGEAQEEPTGGAATDRATATASDATTGGAKNAVSKHCVRCHRDFGGPDDERAGSRCEIPHMFDEERSVIIDWPGPGYSKTYRYDSACCGKKVRMEEEGSGNEDYTLKGKALKPCVTLKHTTNPAEVQYNRSNVIECVMDAEGKCDLDPLDQDEVGPDTRPFFLCNGYDLISAKDK